MVITLCAVFVHNIVAPSLYAQSLTASEESSANLSTRLSLTTLLAKLAARVDRFEHALPDFVTTETFIQESYKNGKLIEHNNTISLLAGRQLRVTRGNQVELSFKELRQVQSINGKLVKQKELKLEGIQVGGAFSSILLAHFASRDQLDYLFELSTELHSLRGRPSYLLTFLSRPDHNGQYYLFNGKSYQSQQRGRAWIDAETTEPLRIEYYELNLPKGFKSMFYAVDYAPIELGEESFTLPIAAITEVEEDKLVSRARHEYRDYKKFSTDVKID
ncbi:MAG: hypothetical protein AB1489_00495 [Acidobacteriota bacterium]